MDETLNDVGERHVIAGLLARRYGSDPGFGDDCATVRLPAGEDAVLVATTDPCPPPLVAQLGWDDLYHAGWLLATINLSDLAAAGADPLGLMTSYVLPGDLRVDAFERLVSGVDDACRAHGTRVLGGNLGDGPAVHLTATALGTCRGRAPVGRGGARPGDLLLLVGAPGYLWATTLVRKGHARLDDPEALFAGALRPRAQLAAGRALAGAGLAHAAVDVSDGLRASVAALCDASGVGAAVAGTVVLDAPVADVARQAAVDPFDLAQLWGDWTLLVAVDPGDAAEAHRVVADAGSRAQCIGSLTERPGLVRSGPGEPAPWPAEVDNERFTPRSWRGDALDAHVSWLLRHARRNP